MKRTSPKISTVFACTSCGQSHSKWMGKCTACGEWNTLVEERVEKRSSGRSSLPSGKHATPITDVEQEHYARHQIGIGEIDRVLGGGLVPGSVILLGGEPGVGKSTLLLMAAFQVAKAGHKALYVSAEESISQIRMTAERLGTLDDNLYLLAETDLSSALAETDALQPTLLILDSVQTLQASELDSAPGSVGQVREVTHQVMRVAKQKNIATFLVGHITKEGAIAGPKMLEHMVDTVLYFESTRTGPHRILRAHKNRFGSTNEMAVFEMHGDGLREVTNPSAFFLSERQKGKSGSAIVVAIEGSRPFLVEIQALCVSTLFGTPRRTALGVDSTRCSILAAVLEKRAGITMTSQDLFVNVAGGFSIVETASDLPLALAIVSSVRNQPVDPNMVAFGEIGLLGEIRGVNRIEERLREAHQLGFTRVMLPKINMTKLRAPPDLELIGVQNIEEAIAAALV